MVDITGFGYILKLTWVRKRLHGALEWGEAAFV